MPTLVCSVLINVMMCIIVLYSYKLNRLYKSFWQLYSDALKRIDACTTIGEVRIEFSRITAEIEAICDKLE